MRQKIILDVEGKINPGDVFVVNNDYSLKALDIHELLPDLTQAKENINQLLTEVSELKEIVSDLVNKVKELRGEE